MVKKLDGRQLDQQLLYQQQLYPQQQLNQQLDQQLDQHQLDHQQLYQQQVYHQQLNQQQLDQQQLTLFKVMQLDIKLVYFVQTGIVLNILTWINKCIYNSSGFHYINKFIFDKLNQF